MYSHRGLGVISGLIWLTIGIFLLWRGLSLVVGACEATEGAHWLVDFLALRFGSAQKAAIVMMSTGLVIGYIKGRLVFRKTAMRYLDRITSLPNPSPVRQLYGVSSYVLLALMMGLGMSLRRLGVPEEVRGTILVAVGSGLIQGATTIFRAVTRLAGAVTS